jgi:hypothetical protein
VESEYNDTILHLTNNLKIFKNDSYSISVYLKLFNETPTFYVRVTIALPNPNGEFSSIIASTTQDMCRYLKTFNTNPFMKLFFNGHFGKKKFPINCPIKADDYFIEDFRLYDNILKMRLSETKFMVVIDFCDNEFMLSSSAKLKIFGEIRELRKIKHSNTTI